MQKFGRCQKLSQISPGPEFSLFIKDVFWQRPSCTDEVPREAGAPAGSESAPERSTVACFKNKVLLKKITSLYLFLAVKC